MPVLRLPVRTHLMLAMGVLAGCSGRDLVAPTADAPDFDRSVRVASLAITSVQGDMIAGLPIVVQVQALDKKGHSIRGLDVTAESVDWASHWPGLPTPPADPGAQTARTDATGTATFTLVYPAMYRAVTWRASAGDASVTTELSIAIADNTSACSAFWGQYTREQIPECFQ